MTEIEEISYFPEVSEVISLPVFHGARLLGGGAGLNRTVEGINLSDTPEYYKWLSKGELMATTCYAIHDDPEAVRAFLPNLAEKGISAVCIKPAQYLKEIPSFMVEQADAYGLPLLELPASVQLSELTKGVSDELLRRQTALLRSTLQVNEMLTRTIIEGAGLPDIARMISELAGTSVLILDNINHRKALAVAKRDQNVLGVLSQENAISAVVANARVHELEVGGHSFGYLYLYSFDHSTYLQNDILHQILQTIPLEISRERSVQERSDDGFIAYLRHIFSDPITDEGSERLRAAEYGLNLEYSHMLLQLEVVEQDASGGHYAVEFQRTLLTSNLLSMLTNLALSPRLLPLVDGFLVMMSAPANSVDLNHLSARFPEYLRSLTREYPALRLTGGCGRPHTGLDGLILSRREAEIALRAAAGRDGVLLRFEDLGVLRLIYAKDTETEIDHFVREKLGELVDASHPRNAELMRTLSSYFDNFGNVKRMSEELFTHYNTVAYRLKNVQELTGADFRKATDRFEVELALYLYDFQKRQREKLDGK